MLTLSVGMSSTSNPSPARREEAARRLVLASRSALRGLARWARHLVDVALLLFVGLFAAMVLGFALLELRERLRERPFSAEAWRAASEQDRIYLVDDLIARAPGMSRGELRALLGTEHPASGAVVGEVIWWIGVERGPLRWDDVCLMVRVDPREVALEARVRDCSPP